MSAVPTLVPGSFSNSRHDFEIEIFDAVRAADDDL